MKALVAGCIGTTDVLSVEEVDDPEVAGGDVLVRVETIGVNYVEGQIRRGDYPAQFPTILGNEGAGTVIEVGPDVRDVRVGDRVSWMSGGGSYAEMIALPETALIPVPESVTTEQAAAYTLQGATALVMARRVTRLRRGDVALVHAGAGGVGLLISQVVQLDGATSIAVVSSEAKAEIVRRFGIEEVIVSPDASGISAEVRRRTAGGGVEVVFDSVGRATLMESLDSLAPRGILVQFGEASGFPPPIDLAELRDRGSLFVTRASVRDYTKSAAERRRLFAELFELVGSGRLCSPTTNYAGLAAIPQAQRDMQERRSTGKLIISLRG